SSVRNFKSKGGTRIIALLVPLCFRSSCLSLLRRITNFGNGALAARRKETPAFVVHHGLPAHTTVPASQASSLTVTPTPPTKASPRWLRMVTGVLLFPGLWLGAIFAFDSAVPQVRSGALAPAVWLPPTALFAALVAWLAVRRASTRLLAPFAVVVLATYAGAAWLAREPTLPPKSVETAEPPNLPTNEAPRPAQPAEIPSPAPPPPPTQREPRRPAQTAEISGPAPPPPVPPPAPGSGRGAEPIPQFPWPPPQALLVYEFASDGTAVR